jgi:hypothetical protein
MTWPVRIYSLMMHLMIVLSSVCTFSALGERSGWNVGVSPEVS